MLPTCIRVRCVQRERTCDARRWSWPNQTSSSFGRPRTGVPFWTLGLALLTHRGDRLPDRHLALLDQFQSVLVEVRAG